MNSKIERAENAIRDSGIITNLKSYSPEVVSTIFVNLDTSESDIDIVCAYSDQKTYINDIQFAISPHTSHSLKTDKDCVIARFDFNNFIFEIYAAKTPVKEQMAYRHYQVMKRLVATGGSDFSFKVRALKESGLKTEPAICHLLGIPGDPYTAILDIENWTDSEIEKCLAKLAS